MEPLHSALALRVFLCFGIYVFPSETAAPMLSGWTYASSDPKFA
jgi:hypothetical protein